MDMQGSEERGGLNIRSEKIFDSKNKNQIMIEQLR